LQWSNRVAVVNSGFIFFQDPAGTRLKICTAKTSQAGCSVKAASMVTMLGDCLHLRLIIIIGSGIPLEKLDLKVSQV
jgi:hypothetical protein